MTPILASIVGPPRVAMSTRASIAACHKAVFSILSRLLLKPNIGDICGSRGLERSSSEGGKFGCRPLSRRMPYETLGVVAGHRVTLLLRMALQMVDSVRSSGHEG